jgi:hypothetical protein
MKMENFLLILYLKKMGQCFLIINKDKLVLYRYLLRIEGFEGGFSHIPVNMAFLFKLVP